MSSSLHPGWIRPDWPAAARVRALITTRAGGVSSGAFASLNLSLRVGDDSERVARNRAILRTCLPADPVWVKQVHGTVVIDAAGAKPDAEADGIVARVAGSICTVLTADCLPVLLSDRAGKAVGIAHAGWRGLAGGIIENVVRAIAPSPQDLIAYLGPGIGPRAYEVGEDVRQAFVGKDPEADAAFAPRQKGKYLADLYALARRRLAASGVAEVHGGGFCTAGEERFFSYRRDGTTGRMASLIWLEED
ncbi:MAG TPA: peptidoglycan editing factor PgeF [Burkholderiales bacterium]|nr:peptidoglycan editing factor PgeF [Burkholderiales bacterium]